MELKKLQFSNFPIKMNALIPENPIMAGTQKNFWNINRQKMKHRNSIDV